jgi:RNA polymerase sigma-70 factor, ECF subfamily
MTGGASTADAVTIFEGQRDRLARVAYRMLGSLAEAEDVVQDAWLRFAKADLGALRDPAAWLVRVVTRLCLDRQRAAKARREAYKGPWLPEPFVEEVFDDPVERAEEVSVAFLLALQRLSPLERAVFLLHDVFDQEYAQVAETLDRSEVACRRLAARARGHIEAARPRFSVPDEEAARLAAAFMDAAARNDVAALAAMLADDSVLISDGGGKRSAALRPLVGRDDILAFFKGLVWRSGVWPPPGELRPARVNGLQGFVMTAFDGVETFAFEPGGHGVIAAIYIVRNPDKLRALAPHDRVDEPR